MFKKIIILALSAVILCSCFTACGADKTTKSSGAEKFKLGELEMDELETHGQDKGLIAEELTDITVYTSMNTLQSAFTAGQLDGMVLTKAAAEYLKKSDDSLNIIYNKKDPKTIYYKLAFLKEDSEMYNQFQTALEGLLTDGTVDSLVKTYITDMSVEPVELPHFDGAQTVKIGVTGDFTPMDYVAADGTPAGFNVALLSAIANKLKINIEVPQIEGNARLMALQQGKVDGIFWFRCLSSDSKEEMENILTTSSYYSDYGCVLTRISVEDIKRNYYDKKK